MDTIAKFLNWVVAMSINNPVHFIGGLALVALGVLFMGEKDQPIVNTIGLVAAAIGAYLLAF